MIIILLFIAYLIRGIFDDIVNIELTFSLLISSLK